MHQAATIVMVPNQTLASKTLNSLFHSYNHKVLRVDETCIYFKFSAC